MSENFFLPSGLQQYVGKGYLMIICISASLSVLLYLFRYQEAGIFTDSPEVASLAGTFFFLRYRRDIRWLEAAQSSPKQSL